MKIGKVIANTGEYPHSIDLITRVDCVIISHPNLTQQKAREIIRKVARMCNKVEYEGDNFALRLLGIK